MSDEEDTQKGDMLPLEGGMFQGAFEFQPNDKCTLEDLVSILKAMKIRFPPDIIQDLPKSTRRQFIFISRNGDELTYEQLRSKIHRESSGRRSRNPFTEQ